jgi:hypothetical protein
VQNPCEKSAALHSNNELAEREIIKTIPFTMNKIKFPRNKLNQENE